MFSLGNSTDHTIIVLSGEMQQHWIVTEEIKKYIFRNIITKNGMGSRKNTIIRKLKYETLKLAHSTILWMKKLCVTQRSSMDITIFGKYEKETKEQN